MNKIAKYFTKAALSALLIGSSISAQVVSIVNNSGAEQSVIFRVEGGEPQIRHKEPIVYTDGGLILKPGQRALFAAVFGRITGISVCLAGQCQNWKNEASSYTYEPVGETPQCEDVSAVPGHPETSGPEFEINTQGQIKFTLKCYGRPALNRLERHQREKIPMYIYPL